MIWMWAGGLAALLLLILAWQMYGRGPRLRRGMQRARRRLAQGNTADALDRAQLLRVLAAGQSEWSRRLDRLEGDCYHAAACAALVEKRFEVALELSLRAAQLLSQSEVEARAGLQAAMLEEIRRLFAVSKGLDNKPIHDLGTRCLLIQSPCREASFWQGLCFVREGNHESALLALNTARTGEARTLWLGDDPPLIPRQESSRSRETSGVASRSLTTSATVSGGTDCQSVLPPASTSAPRPTAMIDPPLYLAALLLRQGQPREALRLVTEANRLDSNCPFVSVLLGAAMIAGNSDPQLAVRALQRGLGSRGLERWRENRLRAWVEGLPEGRSYVRSLAEKHSFPCPLWGSDWKALEWHGMTALAQGLYRLGQYQEACDLFQKLSQETAPSLAIIRGLGLALARLGKYDEAFKHLRIAHEMEEPKERVTAGFLALCGARGTPVRAEDKIQNVAWAIRLVTRYNAPGDAEWIGLINTLFAEARTLDLPLSQDDQIYLCEHLLSAKVIDPQAAGAYEHLWATFPQAMHPEYAWLFCRAAQEHKAPGPHAAALFARTFAGPDAARAFFSQHGWNFDDLEITYLEYAAAHEPGQFPAVLGPDYAERGISLLLERSAALEQADELDQALGAANVLLCLAPRERRALDRLSLLHHRLRNTAQALQLLETWRQLYDHEPLPLVRQAALLQQEGDVAGCRAKITQALTLAQGQQRARIALLGARLVLQAAIWPTPSAEKNGEVAGTGPAEAAAPALEPRKESLSFAASLSAARSFLRTCLEENAAHEEAQALLAWVGWLLEDRTSLGGLAPRMKQLQVEDPRYHYGAALACLADDDFAGVVAACRRITELAPAEEILIPMEEDEDAADLGDLGIEAAYLEGLAHFALGDTSAAQQTLHRVASTPASPSAPVAQSLLGSVCFAQGDYSGAARWWQAIDAKTRARVKLSEPLAGAMFLTALDALAQERFAEAADHLRAAGKAGCRDRRLGPLLLLALFKAGQHAFYNGDW